MSGYGGQMDKDIKRAIDEVRGLSDIELWAVVEESLDDFKAVIVREYYRGLRNKYKHQESGVECRIKYDKEVGMFVANDPDLGVWTQGESKEKAERNLEDAVMGFLFVAYKNGALKDIINKI